MKYYSQFGDKYYLKLPVSEKFPIKGVEKALGYVQNNIIISTNIDRIYWSGYLHYPTNKRD